MLIIKSIAIWYLVGYVNTICYYYNRWVGFSKVRRGKLSIAAHLLFVPAMTMKLLASTMQIIMTLVP